MEKIEFNNPQWEEVIYYGSPNIVCYLDVIENDKSRIIEFKNCHFKSDQTKNSINDSLYLVESQTHLGKDYSNLFLPCVSANNIEMFEHSSKKLFNLPVLIKSKEEESKKQFKGWKSGIRSAIIPFESKYYRLKGCGNNEEGFISKKLNFKKNGEEIRGSQFRHTSIREIFMSNKVQERLEKYGVKITNKPIGMIEYDNLKGNLKDDKERILKTCSIYECLSEKRVGCHLMPGVELLFLFFPIEFLKLNSFTDISQHSFSKEFNYHHGLLNVIKGMFKEERWIRKSKPCTTYVKSSFDINNHNEYSIILKRATLYYNHKDLVRVQLINFEFNYTKEIIIKSANILKQSIPNYNFSMPITQFSPTYQFNNVINFENKENIEELFSKFKVYMDPIDRKHFTTFLELKDLIKKCQENEIFEKAYSVFDKSEYSSTNYPGKLRYENLEYSRFVFSVENNKIHKELILKLLKLRVDFFDCTDKVEKLFDGLDESFLFLTALLYSRIGWEIGKIKRILQDEKINWGTYEDQPFRIHCNAHTDNLAILPEKYRGEFILSILDFDLSFFKENFICVNKENASYGKNDEKLFDEYLNFERQHLEWEISGMENMNIFTYIYDLNLQEDVYSSNFNILFSLIVYLLRDNCVLGYQDGFLNKEYLYADLYSKYKSKLNLIIELGLFSSHDFMG